MLRLVLATAAVVIAALVPVEAQIDVRIGFDIDELHATNHRVHHDTCGIHTGATDGLDEALGEIDWPPPFNSFDATWVSPDARLRLDLRPPPNHNRPPYIVDYEIEVVFSRSYDTIEIRWQELPPGIDSIHIEDSIPGLAPGTYFSAVVNRSSAYPDSLLWWKPNGGAVDLTRLRVRVFYDESATGVREDRPLLNVAKLTISPHPAHDKIVIGGDKIGAGAIAVVRDVLGNPVRYVVLLGERTSLDVSGLPNGLYSLTLLDGVRTRKTIFVIR